MGTNLEGKIAVVTGASSGIGLATARLLAAEGVRVIAAARSAERLAELAATEKVAAMPLDVSQPTSIERFSAAVHEQFGAIHCLVNNAGIGFLESFLDANPERWRRILDTNLTGALLLARLFLPAMIERGTGVVVNVGSTAAVGWPYMTLYAASKAALHAASLSIDHEVRGSGVRVLSVEIGPTAETNFGAGFDPEQTAAVVRLWREIGVLTPERATPQESARKIVDAVVDALR